MPRPASLNKRLRQHVEPGEIPWLSLTGYEVEPHSFSVVKRAISTDSLLDMEYTDGRRPYAPQAGSPGQDLRGRGRVLYGRVGPTWPMPRRKDKLKYVKKDMTINKATGEPRIWQTLRLARIEHAELVKPTQKVDIPDVPVSELRKWNFDNGTPAVFITDQPHLPFIKTLSGATVESCGAGRRCI